MLSPTVIGVVLHLLGLKSNFGQVEVQRGEAKEQHKYIEAKSIEAKLKFIEAKPS